MVLEQLKIALRNLNRRKFRTFLTILGILIGTMAVVALVSIGQGAKLAVEREFEEMGMNKIIVSSSSIDNSQVLPLDKEDAKIIKQIDGVTGIARMRVTPAQISFNSESTTGMIFGVEQEKEAKEIIKSAQGFEIASGKDLDEKSKNEAVVGCLFNKENEIFEDKVELGDKIFLSGEEFEVIGILDCMGSKPQDSVVTISLDSSQEYFGSGMLTIIAETTKTANPETIADEIERKLTKRRGLDEDDKVFSIQTSQDFYEAFNRILSMIQAIIIGIASISLFVGGISIINTMYTTVIERKSEIGIMKAIGARNLDIIQIFLYESSLLGFLGGAVGTFFGIIIGKIAEYIGNIYFSIDFLQVSFSPVLIIGMLIFSTVLGAFFGVWPARIAAKMPAVDAIRKR
jgi:putative ABC transport system permease protein